MRSYSENFVVGRDFGRRDRPEGAVSDSDEDLLVFDNDYRSAGPLRRRGAATSRPHATVGAMVDYLRQVTELCFISTSFMVPASCSRSKKGEASHTPEGASLSEEVPLPSSSSRRFLSNVLDVPNISSEVANLLFTTACVTPSMRSSWDFDRVVAFVPGSLATLVAVALQYLVWSRYSLVLTRVVLQFWFQAASAGVTAATALEEANARMAANDGRRAHVFGDWMEQRLHFCSQLAKSFPRDGSSLTRSLSQEDPVRACLSRWIGGGSGSSYVHPLRMHLVRYVESDLCSPAAARPDWFAVLQRTAWQVLEAVEGGVVTASDDYFDRENAQDVFVRPNLAASSVPDPPSSMVQEEFVNVVLHQWCSARAETIALYCVLTAVSRMTRIPPTASSQATGQDDDDAALSDEALFNQWARQDTQPQRRCNRNVLDSDGEQVCTTTSAGKPPFRQLVMQLWGIVYFGSSTDACGELPCAARLQCGALDCLANYTSARAAFAADEYSKHRNPPSEPISVSQAVRKRARDASHPLIMGCAASATHVSPSAHTRAVSAGARRSTMIRCDVCGQSFKYGRFVVHARRHGQRTLNEGNNNLVKADGGRSAGGCTSTLFFVDASNTSADVSASPSALLDPHGAKLPSGMLSGDAVRLFIGTDSMERKCVSPPHSTRCDAYGVDSDAQGGGTLYLVPAEEDCVHTTPIEEFLSFP